MRDMEHLRTSDSGQALVEFALIVPLVLFLLMGLIEWSFVMNTSSSVNYASRDGAMLAAEGGNAAGTDCVALRAIERDLVAPALPPRIQKVEIYWSDANGVQVGSANNLYTRTGSTTCDYADGSSITVPYTLTSPGYPESSRCDVLAGCGGSHTGLDIAGVRITYQHQWATSFGQYIAGTVIFKKSTAIRMEPQK